MLHRPNFARYFRAALRLDPSAAAQLCASWQFANPVAIACNDAFRSSGSAA
jgi:hypothetical protein